MAISEQQLQTWSHQGSKTQSAATYDTIRTALSDANAPYAAKNYDIFLQGSYGNDTNIYSDSDVDIVMCLTSVYYYDISSLNAEDTERYNRNRTPGQYSFDEFKAEVTAWLTQNFCNGVKAGKKAIFIPGNGTRRDTDVLVCVEHRDYQSYKAVSSTDFFEGICFWTSDGTKIVNYPKQHAASCTTKHQDTSNHFKPNIRVLKNMRNVMKDKGFLTDGVAPSYFLEGMLWNVPSDRYVNSFQDTFLNYMGWLEQCNSTQLLCANQRYYLLRDGHPVCWNLAHYQTFLKAARRFWNA